MIREGRRIQEFEDGAMKKIDTSWAALQALPALDQLGVHPEMMAAAEELSWTHRGPGVEPSILEIIVRLAVATSQNYRGDSGLERPNDNEIPEQPAPSIDG
jgi:hypothetical protein